MGVLSLLAASSAAFFVWLTLAYSSQKVPPHSPTHLAQMVQEAPTFEGLKSICGHWASIEDRRSEFLGQVLDANRQLLNIVVGGVLIWGLVSGAGFLFIYAASRKAGQ